MTDNPSEQNTGRVVFLFIIGLIAFWATYSKITDSEWYRKKFKPCEWLEERHAENVKTLELHLFEGVYERVQAEFIAKAGPQLAVKETFFGPPFLLAYFGSPMSVHQIAGGLRHEYDMHVLAAEEAQELVRNAKSALEETERQSMAAGCSFCTVGDGEKAATVKLNEYLNVARLARYDLATNGMVGTRYVPEEPDVPEVAMDY